MLVCLAIIFAFFISIIQVFGFKVYGVLTGSMEPAYPTGSLIYVRKVDPNDLVVGDVITFSLSPNVIATHRIVSIVPDENNPAYRRFQTKGDANKSVDASLVDPSAIIGRVSFCIPMLGDIANYIQKPPGTYVAILFSGILILFVFLTDAATNEKASQKKQQAQSASAGGYPNSQSGMPQQYNPAGYQMPPQQSQPMPDRYPAQQPMQQPVQPQQQMMHGGYQQQGYPNQQSAQNGYRPQQPHYPQQPPQPNGYGYRQPMQNGYPQYPSQQPQNNGYAAQQAPRQRPTLYPNQQPMGQQSASPQQPVRPPMPQQQAPYPQQSYSGFQPAGFTPPPSGDSTQARRRRSSAGYGNGQN